MVLNREKSIETCLSSVANQSCPSKKIEHIVIDGGSTDKTLSIIKKYQNKLKYWQNKKDKGLYDAMNIGIRKCSGDIIGILNSDDFFYKNTFNIVVKYFNRFKIDFLFGSVIKHKIFHSFYPEKLWYTFNIYPSHSVSFFIKRKSQMRIGNYNIKFKYSVDRDLFYRMINKYKLRGIATKRKEIFGKFSLDGISSKIPFLKKVKEETTIRLINKENIFQVFIILIVYLNYYLIRFLFKDVKKKL